MAATQNDVAAVTARVPVLTDAERDAFAADPGAFMERFGLSAEQKEAVRARDFHQMIELGGNIYFIYKIGTHQQAAVGRGPTRLDRS